MSKLYARIKNSVVVELITISVDQDINALYTPELVLTMVLATQATGTPTVGKTWDGSAFHAPVIPPPTPDQLLATKLTAGIQISSNTDQLAGTYAIDQNAFNNITGLVALIGAGVDLPMSPLPYPDITGTPHSLAISEIKALAGAMGTYVFELRTTWNGLVNGQFLPLGQPCL